MLENKKITILIFFVHYKYNNNKMTNVIPVPAPAPVYFDQVVKGNVYIKQMSKNKYKITFRKIDNFLKYQVWSDSSKNLNERRIVYYQKAKKMGTRFYFIKYKSEEKLKTTIYTYSRN